MRTELGLLCSSQRMECRSCCDCWCLGRCLCSIGQIHPNQLCRLASHSSIMAMFFSPSALITQNSESSPPDLSFFTSFILAFMKPLRSKVGGLQQWQQKTEWLLYWNPPGGCEKPAGKMLRQVTGSKQMLWSGSTFLISAEMISQACCMLMLYDSPGTMTKGSLYWSPGQGSFMISQAITYSLPLNVSATFFQYLMNRSLMPQWLFQMAPKPLATELLMQYSDQGCFPHSRGQPSWLKVKVENWMGLGKPWEI